MEYDNIIKYLKENVDVINDLACECNSWDGSLEYYHWYNHDEEFYDIFFPTKDEVARAVYYGGNSYRYTDPYARLNAYGNLETCNEWEQEKDLVDNVEEIFDTWLELYKENNVDCYDDNFIELVKKLGSVDSE